VGFPRAGGKCPDPVQRLAQADAADGFQQIVHGMQLEGIDGMLVVGRAENHAGPRFRQTGSHVDAARTRHLDVEQDQVGPELRHPFHGLHSGLGFTHDLQVRMGGQQLAQTRPRRLLIVDDQYPDHSGFSP